MEGKNVLFIGSSSRSKVEGYERDLTNIGQEVALQNYNLVVGGLFASAIFVINGFLSIRERKGELIAYLPKIEELERYGEPTEESNYKKVGFDVVHFTGLSCDHENDKRGELLVESSDIVVNMTGGQGTRQELFHAISVGKLVLYFINKEFESQLNFQQLALLNKKAKVLNNTSNFLAE